MRVIAGEHRGRRLRAPASAGTRPVMDRVKESLFSSLAGRVRGAKVLDLYAGAGSFGIEAMSRGADSVVFVESARPALDALRANLAELRIEALVEALPVERWAEKARGRFDLVFCDPPWPMPSVAVADVIESILDTLDPAVTVVATRRTGDPTPDIHGMRISDVRSHGDTTIMRYVMDE